MRKPRKAFVILFSLLLLFVAFTIPAPAFAETVAPDTAAQPQPPDQSTASAVYSTPDQPAAGVSTDLPPSGGQRDITPAPAPEQPAPGESQDAVAPPPEQQPAPAQGPGQEPAPGDVQPGAPDQSTAGAVYSAPAPDQPVQEQPAQPEAPAQEQPTAGAGGPGTVAGAVYQPPAEPEPQVNVENPPHFSVPSGGTVTAKIASDAPVMMMLTGAEGVPENVRIEIVANDKIVAVVEGGQVVQAEPFPVQGETALEIRLSAKGRAVLNGARLHFEPVLVEAAPAPVEQPPAGEAAPTDAGGVASGEAVAPAEPTGETSPTLPA